MLLPHVLLAVTEIVPAEAPVVVEMLVEVEVPDHPEGKVHVYEVAPDTAAMLYVSLVPLHTEVLPLIAEGVANAASADTLNV